MRIEQKAYRVFTDEVGQKTYRVFTDEDRAEGIYSLYR